MQVTWIFLCHSLIFFLRINLVDRLVHLNYLGEAIQEARKCEVMPGAFSVGCVIVTHWPELQSSPIKLAAGYSRELSGNTHAEANALAKVNALSATDLFRLFGEQSEPPTIQEILGNADVYTTMV